MAKKKPKVELEFMELLPVDDEDDMEDLDEDEESLDDEDLDLEEEDTSEGDLDEEGMMLAETVLGDGDMATRAQALKDFVKHCMGSGDREVRQHRRFLYRLGIQQRLRL